MAQDYSDITGGRRIPTQIPLDVKEWVADENTLSYLGVSDNLAFTYHDKIIINCFLEGTSYIWREVQPGEENTGLVPIDFTYPADVVIYGIDYSNKTYNFFKINGVEDKYEVIDVGLGESVFKNKTTIGNTTNFNFKGIKSNTLNITTSLDGNDIEIETPETSEILQFIVNSDYTGDEELGTLVKPFKNLANALTAFIGSGNNKSPEFTGVTIRVQKDINVFTGSLTIANLNLIVQSGANLVCNPSLSQWVIDFDNDAILPVGYSVFTPTESTFTAITLTVEQGAVIVLQKQGFKNRGTTYNDNLSKGRIINLKGSGNIVLSIDLATGSPSIRKIISGNEGNLAGYFNGGNVAHFGIECNITAYNSKLIYIGESNKVRFLNGAGLNFSDNVTALSNVNTIPIEISNGDLSIVDSSLQCYGYLSANQLNRFIGITGDNAVLYIDSCKTIGFVSNLIENLGVEQPAVRLLNFNNLIGIVDDIFKSDSVVWTNVKTEFSKYISGSLNTDQIELLPNTINSFGDYLMETLQSFSSKSAAVAAGLVKGAVFMKVENVDADDLQSGVEYKITTVGSPALGTLGDYFTATGTETGTGVGTLYTRETVI
jgi:hypothetical protein